MIDLTNTFICLAVPLILAAFLLKGETRRFIGFFTLGLLVCLLCAHINRFVAARVLQNGVASLNIEQIMAQITPICEEIMKAIPVFWYVAVRRPDESNIIATALAVGLGFATFENCSYLTEYGASDTLFTLIRGASSGTVHATCAAILGFGLALLCGYRWLAVPGAFALLCTVTTFHALYNMLVTTAGIWRAAGYAFPLITAIVLWAFIWTRNEDDGQGAQASPE